MAEALTFREIAPADIAEVAALVADSFVGYRAFAPANREMWVASSIVSSGRILVVGRGRLSVTLRRGLKPAAQC
jgi:hypothetical protein